jgi:hypothetical protein
MERRFLRAVYDRGKRSWGAYCTRWNRWKYPKEQKIEFRYRGQPKKGGSSGNRVGGLMNPG